MIDWARDHIYVYTFKIMQFSRNNALYYVAIMRLCEQNTGGWIVIKPGTRALRINEAVKLLRAVIYQKKFYDNNTVLLCKSPEYVSKNNSELILTKLKES